jgi:protein-S-isoprenylcysteine O-methyltransferase Ste14
MVHFADRSESERALTIGCFLIAALVPLAIMLDTGLRVRELGALEIAFVAALLFIAGFLFITSLFSLAAYFLFMPSVREHGHLFSAVHGLHMAHPVLTAAIFGECGWIILSGSAWGWAAWIAAVGAFIAYTAVLIRNIRAAEAEQGAPEGPLFHALNLIFGANLVAAAAGARALSPWKVDTLAEDVWIVDVRTQAEFKWNRMQDAENYPWGMGLAEAAETRDKRKPVMVVCFSGHRSPTVAFMLRRLGFTSVYHLNWGLLYYMLLERSKKREGPFALTRSLHDPNARGKDFRGISIGYIVCAVAVFVIAPIDASRHTAELHPILRIAGAFCAIAGGIIAALSFRALGRNFRVFAAPRRSGTLITRGVYSKIRHPMYIAVIMTTGGYALFFGSIWAAPFWLGVVGFYVAKAVKEEELLLAKYPDYASYRARTWRFIPYVW